MHQSDLPVDDLFTVLLMLHRFAAEVEILGIDPRAVENLIKLGAQILYPVIPLRGIAMVAHRFDVDPAGKKSRNAAVLLSSNDAATMVDDKRAPAEGVDRNITRGIDIVSPHIRRDDIHIIIERPRTALILE